MRRRWSEEENVAIDLAAKEHKSKLITECASTIYERFKELMPGTDRTGQSILNKLYERRILGCNELVVSRTAMKPLAVRRDITPITIPSEKIVKAITSEKSNGIDEIYRTDVTDSCNRLMRAVEDSGRTELVYHIKSSDNDGYIVHIHPIKNDERR